MNYSNMASTAAATAATKLRPDYFSKKESELYDGMRSLPIRMKDRRELYADLEAIYDFTSQLQDVGKKRIPFFRLRLYFQILKYKLKELGMWEHSLREIEIQRGTLTANVFYFIRWTMLFNLVLSIVAILGMYLPYAIFFILFSDARDNMACNVSEWNETDPNRKVLNNEELADCCHAYLVYKGNEEKNGTNGSLQALLNFSKIFGGHTSSFLTTPFFFGYYSTNVVETMRNYESYRLALPVLYNISVILIIVISFCVLVKAIGNGVAEIVRNKDGDVCIFSELVFCGFWHRAQDDNEARFRRKLWLHNLRVAIKQAKATARAGKASTALITKRWACFTGCNLIIIVFAVAIYYLAASCYEQARLERELARGDDTQQPQKTQTDQNEQTEHLVRGIIWSLLPSIGIAIGNGALPTFFIRVGRIEGYALELSTVIVLCRSLAVRLLSVGLAISRVITNDYACLSVVENTCTVCLNSTPRETCWESHLGRELYKIIFTELVIKCLLTFIVDPARKLMKKIMFGLKAMRALGTLSFNVVRHSLDIINIQVMSWIGFYFAPAYPLAVVFYLVVIFYVKKFSVLVNCTGTPEAYRVSRTTTIFLLGELVSFVIVVIFLIVVLGYLEPSKGCGPFHAHKRTWQAFQVIGEITDNSGQKSRKWWAYVIETMISPSVYIPLQIGSLAWLIHKYYATVANRDYYESLKDLIILENQDKQYLVNRLLKLRAEFYNINYFDPISIYDSEQKYVESTNRRLMKQWQALATVKRDSGPTTSKWYEGLRRRESSTGSRKFPSQNQLQDLVELHTEYEKKLKDQEAVKPQAIPQSRSRKTVPGRRITTTKRAKTPGTDEEQKPYSAPSMLYLLVNKHKGKKKHSKKKKTISVPPRSKKVAPAALKKKHLTDGSSAPTTSAPTSGTEPDPETSESEAGLKRRKGKVEKKASRRHSKKGSKRRKRASSVKKGSRKRRVAPAAVSTTTTEDETSSATTSKAAQKDGTTTDDDEFNYLWDSDAYGGV